MIYVAEGGSLALGFRQLLSAARKSLDNERTHCPDDSFRLAGYHNAATADVLGAHEWAALLRICQYMGPANDAPEQEWRVVQNLPLYSVPKTSEVAVTQLSPAQGWARVLNSIKISSQNIRFILVPKGCSANLHRQLPPKYVHVEIREQTNGQ